MEYNSFGIKQKRKKKEKKNNLVHSKIMEYNSFGFKKQMEYNSFGINSFILEWPSKIMATLPLKS